MHILHGGHSWEYFLGRLVAGERHLDNLVYVRHVL